MQRTHGDETQNKTDQRRGLGEQGRSTIPANRFAVYLKLLALRTPNIFAIQAGGASGAVRWRYQFDQGREEMFGDQVSGWASHQTRKCFSA